ncbi:hypothetical protein OG994_04065 [Micromonospora globbae]|uniref:Uncharacterized protein n=1 Tax=Micromonospora globbae TaxID=1894969 RepID=A0ABZ1SB49_9ACTN|nr:hypothetical protein [Micromonospora globbae]
MATGGTSGLIEKVDGKQLVLLVGHADGIGQEQVRDLVLVAGRGI